MHHIHVGRGTTLRHTAATFGGEVVRIVSRITFTASGSNVDLLSVCFADAGQYFGDCMLVSHAVPNYRPDVIYKDALQDESNVAHREVRTVWMGDALIRAETTDTDTYEPNRNLLLIEGTRADAVPNLEIETGEIADIGHAATVGRSGEEQLFHLFSRGISELVTHRLVVCSFFSGVINLISAEPVCEKLERLVGEELNTAGP